MSTPKNKKSILISSHDYWALYNFRSNLIKGLIDEGYKLILLSNYDGYELKFEHSQIRCLDIDFNPQSINPFIELCLLFRWLNILKKESPDIALHFGIKPNIYGGFICKILGVPFINNISGLGNLFSNQRYRYLEIIFKKLQKLIYQSGCTIFFQNHDNYNYYLSENIVREENSFILPGSGVDLNKFNYKPKNYSEDKISFLYSSRLLIAKGIRHFLKAAKIISDEFGNVEFIIAGSIRDSKEYISQNELDLYINKQIRYVGFFENTENLLHQSSCLVLPTQYGEGTPRIILESLATGTPVITSDTSGCNEAIIHGKNGLLCKEVNTENVLKAIKEFLFLSKQAKNDMSRYARISAEIYYDENIVINKYLTAINTII